MSNHSSGDAISSVAISAIGLLLIFGAIIGLLLFRSGALIVRAFRTAPKNRVLWLSFGLCLGLCLGGGPLTAFVSPGWLTLAVIGWAQFLIICKRVAAQAEEALLVL